MKLLFLLVVTLCICLVTYAISALFLKGKKNRRYSWVPLGVASVVGLALVGLIGLGAYSSLHQPDTQCGTFHNVATTAPSTLTTALDYFAKGNDDYDMGNCQQAIIDYTKAISLNPSFAKAYNNRAYTYMRLREYKDALLDLDTAITLNPTYTQALMNRGDIHNYYYQIDRAAAIADYKKVIALTGPERKDTSVCGHLFLAKHNGWTFSAFLGLLTGEFRSCK